jgi:hypothetical protein
MKNLILSVVATAVLGTTPVFAADMPIKARPPVAEPSPWDWAFGGALLSDYNFRGISQSNRSASVTAYSETRYNVNSNFQLYAGAQYWAVTLPTSPSCECDLYGGIRPTVGPFAFDFGFIYYWYPRERPVFLDPATGGIGNPFIPGAIQFTLSDTDYYEGYGKVSWDVIKDRFNVGANFYYSPSWLHTGAYGAYGSVTAKATMPSFRLGLGPIDELGWYISGEVGHYWLGTTGAFFGNINLPDYTTWNVGLAFTWKVATFDIRYYDTDLSKANCFILTGDLHGLPGGFGAGVGQSNWCSASVVGAVKFDLTAMTNLK